MVPNARFWVYWNGDFAKLALRPGQEITFGECHSTDEGWSSEFHTYRHAGNCVECDLVCDGSDCDGRLTHVWKGHCPLSGLKAREAEPDPCGELRDGLPARPDWIKGTSLQRDGFAELAGY